MTYFARSTLIAWPLAGPASINDAGVASNPGVVSVSGGGLRETLFDEIDQVSSPVANPTRADLDRARAITRTVPPLHCGKRDTKELGGVLSRTQSVPLGVAEIRLRMRLMCHAGLVWLVPACNYL
jgi:hypothetical protein